MSDSLKSTNKPDQVLLIEPKNEIIFKGPFDQVVTSKIKLTNPSNDRICFKVKTTAPKRYCVRPNNGVVEPNSTTTVIVMLQPFDFDSAADKNKHKFMIQTLVEPANFDTLENMWKVYSNYTMDSKLKCIFDNSDSGDSGYVVNKVKPENVPSETDAFSSNFAQTDLAREFEEYQLDQIPSASTTKILNESDIPKILEESKRIKEENSSLKQELMKAREEGLKQRHVEKSFAFKPVGESSERNIKTNLSSTKFDQIMLLLVNPFYLFLFFCVFIFGVTIGSVFF